MKPMPNQLPNFGPLQVVVVMVVVRTYVGRFHAQFRKTMNVDSDNHTHIVC